MRCTFCGIPYEDPYDTKPLDPMIEALELALDDPLQPARHILISGGTPIPRDVPFLRNVYETVLSSFPDHDVDIMMTPTPGLFELEHLRELGLHQLSINLELFGEDAAKRMMPQKHRVGVPAYLAFIEEATAVLGKGSVRSMLMVGLEPLETTLRGVQAILDAGGVPVLSPFRPDPATPLRDVRPLPASAYEEAFVEADALARRAGIALGPSCVPCTHNTLSFGALEAAESCRGAPVLV